MIAADLDCGSGLVQAEDDSRNDVVGADRQFPIRKFEGFQILDPFVQQIAVGTAPAMPFVVFTEPVPHGGIRRFLHFDVEGRVDFQAAFVHGGCAVLLFEVPPEFFHEIWRQFVLPLFFAQS